MQGYDRDMLTRLAAKKLKGTLSDGEKRLLDRWLRQLGQGDTLHWDGPDLDEYELRNRLLARIKEDAGIDVRSGKKGFSVLWRVAAVLIIVAGLSVAMMWMVYPGRPAGNEAISRMAADLAPGVSGAVLTLANGRQVQLDSTKNGVVQQLAGLEIVVKDGALYYDGKRGSTVVAERRFNVLTTAYGKQFKIVLPDGTVAWLNAGSSLKYPTVFEPDVREVEMSGEVYFEVTKSLDQTGKRLPFRVYAGTQVIEVLGTRFDVQAYHDDPAIKTTLAEGKVRVVAKGMLPVSLTPGQQSIVKTGASDIVVRTVDTETATSWTRGFFSFRGATIKEVMHQLARWYDVDVAYAKGLPDRRFSGKIYRNLDASSALDALSFMQLHFEIIKQTASNGEGAAKERTLIKVTP